MGLGLILVLGCQKGKSTVDVAGLKRDIQTRLPAGTSRVDVIAFLDQRKIAHERLRIVGTGPSNTAVVSESHAEICLIRDIRTEGWLWNATTMSLRIQFNFDTNDSKLVSCSYQEIFKGL